MRLWLVDGRVEAFQSRLAALPQALFNIVKVYSAYVVFIFNFVNQMHIIAFC